MNSLGTTTRGMQIYSPSSYLCNSNWNFEESKETKWTAEENKLFENALALFDKDTPDRWYNVAAMIPGKTVRGVIKQYKELEEDVSDIEAGLIPIPGYITSDSFTLQWTNNQEFHGLKQYYGPGLKRSSSTQERKKGVPWTEDEHRQFLLGLKKYGKGDWRNISRNYVTTRTPTQVASHAQKYYIRQLSGGKDKRRSSIHDITTVNPAVSKSLSPDDHKAESVDHHHLQQQMDRTVKGLYNGGMCTNGSTMAFDMVSSSLMMSTPRGTLSHGMKMQKNEFDGPEFGSYNKVFQMQYMQPW